MKSRAALLAIDQGTTGTRAILYGPNAQAAASAYQEFPQHFPKPGWVEHRPEEIWSSTQNVVRRVLRAHPQIAALGITNQRETTVLWDRRTGRPVAPAIVWQDRRTTDLCARLKKNGLESLFRKRTGLMLDPYFSGTKIRWLLDHVPGLAAKAKRGDVLFGTIDTWLIWKLTGGRVHATDFTNASRTLLLNLRTRRWDPELLGALGIPKAMLPEVRDSGAEFGRTAAASGLAKGIPIRAVIGDQQAALYGQACYSKGQAKNTYGTGCFVVLNAGPRWVSPPHGLLATLACDKAGRPVYALEGSIFIGGAVIQWLRDGLGFFKKASETERLIRGLKDTGGVTLIPAFAGLGSPYWDPTARGMISGITRGTRREHIIRAALEAVAHQTADVIDQMKRAGVPMRQLRVDGGATHNRFLMQFQADLLGIPVLVSELAESTAWGAAKLAGRQAGFWKAEAADAKRRYHPFSPRKRNVKALRKVWQREIQRVLAH